MAKEHLGCDVCRTNVGKAVRILTQAEINDMSAREIELGQVTNRFLAGMARFGVQSDGQTPEVRDLGIIGMCSEELHGSYREG